MKWLVVPIIWLVLINITILINGETWVLPLICRILLAIYIALTEFNKGAMQKGNCFVPQRVIEKHKENCCFQQR